VWRPYLVRLTSFPNLRDRRLCEEFGFDEYVAKPIELSTLLTWVQKARARAGGV
jgi:CheY-like chemotaxis protein